MGLNGNYKFKTISFMVVLMIVAGAMGGLMSGLAHQEQINHVLLKDRQDLALDFVQCVATGTKLGTILIELAKRFDTR